MLFLSIHYQYFSIFPILPINKITPVLFSLITNTKGLLTLKTGVTGGSCIDVNSIPTTVTAAASLPSSVTYT